jgi:hypothetical protein
MRSVLDASLRALVVSSFNEGQLPSSSNKTSVPSHPLRRKEEERRKVEEVERERQERKRNQQGLPQSRRVKRQQLKFEIWLRGLVLLSYSCVLSF